MIIWRIILNEIIFSNNAMPIVSGGGMLAAAEPFFHTDRTVGFNIMIYVCEGTVFVTEDDTDYEINGGGLVFLKSGHHHFGKREIPKGTRWFYVHFYLDGQNSAESFFDSPHPDLIYTPLTYSAPLPKALSGLEGSRTEERIKELSDYFTSDSPDRDWYLNIRLAELLSFIALSDSSRPSAVTLSDRICAVLRANINEPFSSKLLEKELFLSYKRMAAVFKAEKGITMQQYLDRLKADKASRLLSSTLMPVNEIAAMLGYSDPLYFSRRFRDMTGSSPTEFRKNAAKKM